MSKRASATWDEEGVDVHFIVPGAASGHSDPSVDMAMLRSVHRHLDDMCSRHPGRLTSLILATARDIEGSVLEIKRYADSPWAKGIWVSLPLDYPVDHPRPQAHLGRRGRRGALHRASQLRNGLPRLPRPVEQPVHRQDGVAPVGRYAHDCRIPGRGAAGQVPEHQPRHPRIRLRLAPPSGCSAWKTRCITWGTSPTTCSTRCRST